MNTKDFRYRAIAWLRDQMNVETRCLPHDEIEEDDGTAMIDGEVVRASKANPYRGQALVFIAVSYGVGLASSNGMSAALRTMLGITSGFFAVAAVLLLVVSFFHARGRRHQVVVKMHSDGKPVDEGTIRAVRRKAKRGEAWVIAAAGFTTAAIAMAGDLSVRCFGFDDRFVEQKAHVSTHDAA